MRTAARQSQRNAVKRARAAELFEQLQAAKLADDCREVSRVRTAIVEEHDDLAQAAFNALSARQKVRFNPDDAADLMQCARSGIVKAADRFEPARGNTFATYAYNAANGAMLHWMRDKFNLIREPAADYYQRARAVRDWESGAALHPPPEAIRARPIGLMKDDGGDNETQLYDLIEDDFAPLQTEVIATRDLLNDMKASAGDVEAAARAVELVIGDGYAPAEAAEALQITTEAVEKLVEAGLRYLRAQLNPED